MTDILFYHLERSNLESVLPDLLEKSLARGWRAVVQVGGEERLAALDTHLWTYDDASFLPHGTLKDGNPQDQPVYLTCGEETPNGAAIRFHVDGAAIGDPEPYERVVVIFDGGDDTAVASAREAWRALKEAGHTLTYWQQNERGRWERKM